MACVSKTNTFAKSMEASTEISSCHIVPHESGLISLTPFAQSQTTGSLLQDRIPNDEVYTIEKVPYKGFGLVATSDIAPGTLIVTDPALFTIPEATISNQRIWKSYRALNSKDQDLFTELCDRFPTLKVAFDYHKFSNYIGAQDHTICGFHPVASMVNHSCVPNAAMVSKAKDFAVRIRSTKHIRKGEEIAVNYLPVLPFLGTEDRQRVLSGMSGFQCLCSVCVYPDPWSDARRQLASAMLWLTCPELADDLEGLIVESTQYFGRPLVSDKSLRRRRQRHKLSTSEIQKYARAVVLLLEEEGIEESISGQVLLVSSRGYLDSVKDVEEVGRQRSVGFVDSVSSVSSVVEDMICCLEILERCCGLDTSLGEFSLDICRRVFVLACGQTSCSL